MKSNLSNIAKLIQERYEALPKWKKNTVQFNTESSHWTIDQIKRMPLLERRSLYCIKAKYLGRPQICLMCYSACWIAWEGGYGTPGRICHGCLNPVIGQLDLFDAKTAI